MGKILVIFEFPNTTAKTYDKIVEELHAKAVLPNEGLLFHAAAQEDGTMIVSDVWKSEEAFNKFGEKMMPIGMQSGLPNVKPRIIPVHNILP